MNKNFDINIVLLNENAKLPSKQHELDIGYDIYSSHEYKLLPKKVTFIETGIQLILEKPITSTTEEALDLLRLAKDK